MKQISDALKVAPDVTKIIMENNRVRVFDALFKPGVKAAMHSHPDHVLYILNDGKMKITPSNGKPQTMDIKTGQVIWMDATTHEAENLGTTDVHMLVVELKE
jgi:beta-alanine degradation protein BauB